MRDLEEGQVTEITFEHGSAGAAAASLKLHGASSNLLRSPEKIRELMDLLELPEGTNARVTVVSASVIVR